MPDGAAVVWFRRDLRIHDHPALVQALAGHGRVAPLFVVDRRLFDGARWASPNRAWFMVESLRVLARAIAARGGQLAFREGRPEEAVVAFAREAGASAVYASRDYSPFGRARDAAVAAALQRAGIAFHLLPGLLCAEPEDVRTDAGDPYRVFTPFRKRWERVAPRAVLPAPARIPWPPGLVAGHPPPVPLPTARERPEPGEDAARARLRAWSAGTGLARYDVLRDVPAAGGTSRLSQDLRWGLLSPVEVLAACGGPGAARDRFRAEIAWREFFAHLLFHFPHLRSAPLQAQFAHVRWADDRAALAAWQAGLTGYPFVDAGMRELVATGYMHNRARMVVASFLTKDLLIHWSEGERFFMAHLFDGDLASNNGGWQWAASTGADAQPYFRTFNPVLQGKKFDSQGEYVRRWVPELAGLPTAAIHEPWTLSRHEQERAHCIIGRDYPAPIVDHRFARERALAAFAAAGAGPQRLPDGRPAL
jgi:deoxyribodipyrimidine photo-lyase